MHIILVLTMAANSDIISSLNIWHSVTVKPKLSRSPTVQNAYHSKHESIPSTDVNIGTSACIRSQYMPAVKKKKIPEKSSGDPKGSQQFSPLLPTWIHFTDTMRALVSSFRALYKVVDWCHIFLHNCVMQCRLCHKTEGEQALIIYNGGPSLLRLRFTCSHDCGWGGLQDNTSTVSRQKPVSSICNLNSQREISDSPWLQITSWVW